jgi:RNA polymerase-associated protein LEO1
MTHRKMTMSAVDHGSKIQKVKILTDLTKNPEAQRSEMIKKEEEKLKAVTRRENQQRRLREKQNSKALSASYLEDRYSDEDESTSLNAIKHKFKSGGANSSSQRNSIYSSTDSNDGESDRERRLNRAKASETDASDEEHNLKKKKKKVVADDDD